MKDFIQENISYQAAIATIVTILSFTIFCQFVGFSLLLPLLFLFVGLHLFFLRQAGLKLFLQLGLLQILFLGMTNYINAYTDLSPLLVPVSVVSMLVALLYNDLTLAYLMTFISSIVYGLILNDTIPQLGNGIFASGGLQLTLIFFFGGLTGAYMVHDARTRGRVIASGIFVSMIQVAALILFHHDVNDLVTPQFFFFYIRPLAFNGLISAFLVYATLKIFESWFGRMTNFSLLELADFNHPLMKRMIMEAPGTYHHSLIVSNLSEAAADAIGANSLLTRVGAYYHDIGKMVKPEYFTENQSMGINKHDSIGPSVSRLVIMNHVKEGLELARKYKLNPIIRAFIPEHHGTGLMHYFYQKALEDSEDGNSIKEDAYRYPGPKPQRRETAIVLLADSSEAATRSVEEPNPKKIEETVRKIINNKFIDGQLDDCNLSLKDIELIAQTFTRVLSAMYHGRVKYPEKKNGSDNRDQKPAESDSP